MSPQLVLLVVVAVGIIGFGIQVAARQIQRFPVDTRSPGSIIDTTRVQQFVVRPAELEQLDSIVTGSLTSHAVAASKLQPILAQLAADAPEPGTHATAPAASRRRSREQWLDQQLTELERRWGQAGDGRRSASPGQPSRVDDRRDEA